MRVMAVDYGDERTGIAVSDPLGILVGETFVIKEWNRERLAEKIAEAARERGVQVIVIGKPKNMDGTEGLRAEKSRELAALVKGRIGIDPVMWDERRTTVDAHRILSDNGRYGKKRKELVDAVAASLILEGYLGSIR